MTSHTTTPLVAQSEIETEECLFDNWFDPIETGLRDRTRDFLQAMFEAELDAVLARSRYCRRAKPPSGGSEAAPAVTGHRHGHRSRSLLGTFGKVEIAVPRARLNTPDGKTTEWKSRALRALFGGAVGKDTVSRVWRKVKSDWDAWNARALAEEPIVRLILDGTVVRVRLDRKATAVSLLVAIGVRADG
jgi:transposase-like protein